MASESDSHNTEGAPAAATMRNREVVYQSNASRARRDLPFRTGIIITPDPSWTSAQRSLVGGLAQRSQKEIRMLCKNRQEFTVQASLGPAESQALMTQLTTNSLTAGEQTQWSFLKTAALFVFGFGVIGPATGVLSGVVTAVFTSQLAPVMTSILSATIGLLAMSAIGIATLLAWATRRRSIRTADASWDTATQWLSSQSVAQQACWSQIFAMRIGLGTSELPEIAKRDIRDALDALEIHVSNHSEATPAMVDSLADIEAQITSQTLSQTNAEQILSQLKRAATLGRAAMSDTNDATRPPPSQQTT